MKRPNIEEIQENMVYYDQRKLKDTISHLTAYIESRGQVRSEVEIRERLEMRKGQRATMKRDYTYPCNIRFDKSVNDLAWVLEDSDPKMIEKLEWRHANSVDTGGIVEIHNKINEIIDRFNEVTRKGLPKHK